MPSAVHAHSERIGIALSTASLLARTGGKLVEPFAVHAGQLHLDRHLEQVVEALGLTLCARERSRSVSFCPDKAPNGDVFEQKDGVREPATARERLGAFVGGSPLTSDVEDLECSICKAHLCFFPVCLGEREDRVG